MILCKNLLVCQIDDYNYSLSWELNIKEIKKYLKENYNITKIYNFYSFIDYIIEIDNVNTFDSINKRSYIFKTLEHNVGKIVQSCIIHFEPQLENTSFYVRVKIIDDNYTFITDVNNVRQNTTIQISDEFDESYNVIINKSYILDIIKAMYNGIPDRYAYSKGAYDANFYYILQCFAIQDNYLYNKLNNIKNNFFLYKCNPNNLNESFGGMLGFEEPTSMTDEEYRRLLAQLFISLQNAGTEKSITNVIQYLIGDEVDILYYTNFYPWILREKNYQEMPAQHKWIYENTSIDDPNPGVDDVNVPPNPSYINNSSNYFLFKQKDSSGLNWEYANRKNKAILLNKNFKIFNFQISSENFFNNVINTNAIEELVNKLKPLYTKYFLNIDAMEE